MKEKDKFIKNLENKEVFDIFQSLRTVTDIQKCMLKPSIPVFYISNTQANKNLGKCSTSEGCDFSRDSFNCLEFR